jgi:hypothetical protein
MKVLFIIAGGCRTFLECYDNIYNNLIIPFSDYNKDIIPDIYLYLKLSDPGKKDLVNWNFDYKQMNKEDIINKINSKHYTDYKILEQPECSDLEHEKNIKNNNLVTRPKMISVPNDDFGTHVNGESKSKTPVKRIIRGMQCHYNYKQCGEYILELEKKKKIKYDYIVFCRPDLYFLKSVKHYSSFNKDLICTGDKSDRLAYIPRKYMEKFFFDRYNVYINNASNFNNELFYNIKDVYFKTIKDLWYQDKEQETRLMRPDGLSNK